MISILLFGLVVSKCLTVDGALTIASTRSSQSSTTRATTTTTHAVVHNDDDDDDHEELHWSYDGMYAPTNWSVVNSKCSSAHRRQSPIDIDTDDTQFNELLDSLLVVVDGLTSAVTLTNNGHTVNLQFSTPIRLNGGNLGNAYRVVGAHFHWGENNNEGSEHTINGRKYPLELHIVSFDEGRYSSVAEALSGNNSIAVVGILFELSQSGYDNVEMSPIITALKNVLGPGNSTTLRDFNVTQFLPSRVSSYYRYMGSLTTPPCAEVVIWTVAQTTYSISAYQVQQFRLLDEELDSHHEKHLVHNWRPTQPMYSRTVQRSFPDATDCALSPTPTVTIVIWCSVISIIRNL